MSIAGVLGGASASWMLYDLFKDQLGMFGAESDKSNNLNSVLQSYMPEMQGAVQGADQMNQQKMFAEYMDKLTGASKGMQATQKTISRNMHNEELNSLLAGKMGVLARVSMEPRSAQDNLHKIAMGAIS